MIIINIQHCCRHFSKTTLYCAGSKWRLKHGLGKCGNEYGPLTDIPDWSFIDGTMAPPGYHEKLRRQKKIEMGEALLTHLSEMEQSKIDAKNQIDLPKRIERPKIYPITSSRVEIEEI